MNTMVSVGSTTVYGGSNKPKTLEIVLKPHATRVLLHPSNALGRQNANAQRTSDQRQAANFLGTADNSRARSGTLVVGKNDLSCLG